MKTISESEFESVCESATAKRRRVRPAEFPEIRHRDFTLEGQQFIRRFPSIVISIPNQRKIVARFSRATETEPNQASEPTSGTGAVSLTRPLRSARDCFSKYLSHALPLAAHL